MTSWYHAICHAHREVCSIFVVHSPSDKIEWVFPDPAQTAAIQFLSDHWTCPLQLARDDNTDWPSDYKDKTPP